MKIFLSFTLFLVLFVGVFAPQSSPLLPKNNGVNDVELIESSRFRVDQPDVRDSQSDGFEEESEEIGSAESDAKEGNGASQYCRDNPHSASCVRYRYQPLRTEEWNACRQSPTLLRQFVAIQNSKVGDIMRRITVWAANNHYDDLPRELLNSYFVILEISRMETIFFNKMPQIMPLQESGSFPAIIDGDIENARQIAAGRRDPLVNADGTVNAFGKSVMATAFRGNLAVRPLIALDLKNEADQVFEELAKSLRSESADELLTIEITQLVQQFERRVLGNLNMPLRMLRLAKGMAANCKGFNPIPLLIAYMKWPDYPNERPVDSQFVDDSMQSILAVDVLTGGNNQYELTENTEFDRLILENTRRIRNTVAAVSAMRCIVSPLSVISNLGTFGTIIYMIFHEQPMSMTPLYLLAVFYALSTLMRTAANRITSYDQRRRSTLSEFERDFMDVYAPEEMDPDVAGQIFRV